MTYELTGLAIWAAGALTMLAWMFINEWPTRHEDAREAGLPGHDAFFVAAFLAAASVWFAMPAIHYIERRQR